MGHRKTPPGNTQKTPANSGERRGGFTLIEMVIAIVILGILSAAVGVNWSSFMQHQRLRQDALSLHKEILALKARAVEHNDTVKIVFKVTGTVGRNEYEIKWIYQPENEDNYDATKWVSKTISLNNGTTITIDDATSATDGLPTIANANNKWKDGSITIAPGSDLNINAFPNGRIVIKSSSAKGEFCIQKDDTGIKPEIYYRSKAGDSWKKA